nr:TetR/AcrR family transcriptional regulator [Paracoccus amoyensis]
MLCLNYWRNLTLAVNSTLRDRRKLQTAADIQRAAVSLALHSGYDTLTTEMIAAEAGISLRTFFNYYPNKDAAIVGHRPVIDTESAEQFKASSGPLIDALFQMLTPMLTAKIMDREVAKMIGELMNRSPEFLSLFYTSLNTLRNN